MTGRKIDRSLFGDEHVRCYEETDGEVGYIWNDAPILILSTKGRTSGKFAKGPSSSDVTERECCWSLPGAV
jgi:hypothetical protein